MGSRSLGRDPPYKLPRGDETARGKVDLGGEAGGWPPRNKARPPLEEGRATNGKTALKEYYNNHLDQNDHHHHHQQTGQASIRSALFANPELKTEMNYSGLIPLGLGLGLGLGLR